MALLVRFAARPSLFLPLRPSLSYQAAIVLIAASEENFTEGERAVWGSAIVFFFEAFQVLLRFRW